MFVRIVQKASGVCEEMKKRNNKEMRIELRV